jgi:hypothetical protein
MRVEPARMHAESARMRVTMPRRLLIRHVMCQNHTHECSNHTHDSSNLMLSVKIRRSGTSITRMM